MTCLETFVCVAALCWDDTLLSFAFYNVTKCTPSPLALGINLRLIPILHNSPLQSPNGFSCNNCSLTNFLRDNPNSSRQCAKQLTKIELKNYCHDFSMWFKKTTTTNTCECIPAKQPIQPIQLWTQNRFTYGKSHLNHERVKTINQNAIPSVLLLMGICFLLILIGGSIGVMFDLCKQQSSILT